MRCIAHYSRCTLQFLHTTTDHGYVVLDVAREDGQELLLKSLLTHAPNTIWCRSLTRSTSGRWGPEDSAAKVDMLRNILE